MDDTQSNLLTKSVTVIPKVEVVADNRYQYFPLYFGEISKEAKKQNKF